MIMSESHDSDATSAPRSNRCLHGGEEEAEERYSNKDRSKCSVCELSVNECYKRAQAFNCDWMAFLVLHPCANPECSGCYCVGCAMVATLHQSRAKRVPICRFCHRQLFFPSLPHRAQVHDENYMLKVIHNTPVESRSSDPSANEVLLRMNVERFKQIHDGSFNFELFQIWMMTLYYQFTKTPLDWGKLDRVALTLVWQASFGLQGPVLRSDLADPRLQFDAVCSDPALRHSSALEGLLAFEKHPYGHKIVEQLTSIRHRMRQEAGGKQKLWEVNERIARIAASHIVRARQTYVYCVTQSYAAIPSLQVGGVPELPPNQKIQVLLKALQRLQTEINDPAFEYLEHHYRKPRPYPASDFRVSPGLDQPVQPTPCVPNTSKTVPFPQAPPSSAAKIPSVTNTQIHTVPVPTHPQPTPTADDTPRKVFPAHNGMPYESVQSPLKAGTHNNGEGKAYGDGQSAAIAIPTAGSKTLYPINSGYNRAAQYLGHQAFQKSAIQPSSSEIRPTPQTPDASLATSHQTFCPVTPPANHQRNDPSVLDPRLSGSGRAMLAKRVAAVADEE
ncbi:hypothetical protein L202_00448 [Cryptococcus amylolentus CBS 6039]|uniref:Uncharacterized protein n=1 Tax=Cryptococcus amylolentus CBS 6039 TaxID=1295533 RepID=A0A1E3I9J2_9TREE|nr:hypothetical protein L202_00448 [Cryptococcus amylolentus CBS 6039]ODN84516.1 hypothetical protein L202_00448 [Cryptococcus amylolentus CBS 6039]